MTSRAEGLCVYVRVRPPIFKEVREDTAVHVNGSQSLTLVSDSKEISCSYDHVFNEISEQTTIFAKVQPLLVDVLSGINCCIFAYGQTSAGKSYTMIGPNGGQDVLRCDKNEWGILPRASEYLMGYLNEKSKEGMLTYEVKASFLQIYNENLYDLLRDTGPMIEDKLLLNEQNKDTELKIREIPKAKSRSKDGATEVFVSGLSEFRVQTSDDILRILAVGTSNRMTRSTDFNNTSSRSHAILQLTVEIESHLESGQTLISKSKLNLIDLAGSEKIPFLNSDMNNNAKHMKELTSINKSLSCLGNVIAALSSNNRSHIPYRDSKLTRILQDSLSGNTRTILIACVAPTVLHTSESLSTLQFADRAKNVMLTVKSNTIVDDKVMLAKAQSEITRLKALLSHALKQLEQKSSISDGHSLSDEMQRLMAENESLRKENSYMKGAMNGGGNVSSRMSGNQSSFNSNQNGNSNPNGYGGNQNNHNNHRVPSAVTDNGVMPGRKKHPMSRRASRDSLDGKPLLDTRSLMEGMAKGAKQQQQSSYQAFSDYSGQAGNREKDKPQVAFGRKTKTTPKKGGADYNSDSEYESPKHSKKRSNKQHQHQHPSSDVSDSADKRYSMGESRVHSKLYKAINDRQIDELNHRLANASHQVEEQERDTNAAMETDPITSLLGLPPRKIGQQPTESIHVHNHNQRMQEQLQIQQQLLQRLQQQQQQQQQQFMMSNQQTHQQPSTQRNQDDEASPVEDFMVTKKGRKPGDSLHNSPTRGSMPDLSSSTVQAGALGILVDSPVKFTSSSMDSNDSHQGVGVSLGMDPRQPPPSSAMSASMDQYSQYVKLTTPSVQKPETFQFAPTNRIVLTKKGGGNAHDHSGDGSTYGQSRGASLSTPNSVNQSGFHHPNGGITPTYHHPSGGATPTYHQPNGGITPTMHNSNSTSILAAGSMGGGAGPRSGQVQPQALYQLPHQSQQQQSQYQLQAQSQMYQQQQQVSQQQQQYQQQQQFQSPQYQMQSQPVVAPVYAGEPRAAQLSQSKDDIGTAVQMFSFRANIWDRVDILDYDDNRRLHKVRNADGSVQWLDLTKKPVREFAI